VTEPLTISPATLGPGEARGFNYQLEFTSKGGVGPIAWTVDSGALPPGWSLAPSSASTAMLSGVATANGTYTFTIKAADSSNPPQTVRETNTIQIVDPVVITSSATFPNACVNKPYSFQVTTTGGIAPIRFGFISNTRWVAINLDQNTGIFSGTANVTGTFQGTVSAGDSALILSGASQQVTLNVVNCP